MSDNLSIDVDIERARSSVEALGTALENLLKKFETLKGASSSVDAVNASASKLKLDPEVVKSFEQLNSTLRSLATNRINELQAEIKKMDPSQVNELANAFNKIKMLQDGMQSNNLQSLNAALKATQTDASGAGVSFDRLITSLKGAAAGMLGVNTSVLNVGAGLSSVASSAATTAGSTATLATQFGGLGTAMKVVAALGIAAFFYELYQGISRIGAPAITATEAMIKFTSTLNSVSKGNLGSVMFRELNESARTTGISFGELSQAAAKFGIAAQQAGMTTKEITATFNNLALGFRAAGLSTQETNSAFRALEQMMSKGKIQAQELVLQLSNAVPGALEVAAHAANTTTSGLQEMARAGTLLPVDFVIKFGSAMKDAFGAALQAQLMTVSAQMGRLSVFLEQFAMALGGDQTIGIMVGFASALKGIADILFAVQPAFTALGTAVGVLVGGPLKLMGDFLQGIAAGFRSFFTYIQEGVTWLIKQAEASTTLNAAMQVMSTVIRAAWDAMEGLSRVFGTALGYVLGVATAFGTLRLALSAIALVGGLLAPVFTAVSTAVTASTAAIAAMGVTSAATTGAVTVLGGALNIIRANPIGAALSVAAVALAALGGYFSQTAVAATNYTTESGRAAAITKDIQSAAGTGVEGLSRLANGFGTVEGVMASYNRVMQENAEAMRRVSEAQKDNKLALSDLARVGKEASLSAEHEKEAIREKIQWMREQSQSYKDIVGAVGGASGAVDMYGDRIRRLSTDLKHLEQSEKAYQLTLEDKKRSIEGGNAELEAYNQRLQRQQEEHSKLGIILTAANQQFFDLANAAGQYGKEAGRTAAALELMTRSQKESYEIGKEEVARQEAKLKATKQILEIMDQEIAKINARRDANGKLNDGDEARLQQYKKLQEAASGQVIAASKELIATQALNEVYNNGASIQQAATDAIERYTGKAADKKAADEIIALTTKKMNDELAKTNPALDKNTQGLTDASKAAEQTAENTKKASEQSHVLRDAAVAVGTKLSELASDFGKFVTSLVTTTESSASMAANVQSITTAVTELNQVIPLLGTHFADTAVPAQELKNALPEVAQSLAALGVSIPALSEPLSQMTVSFTAANEVIAVYNEQLGGISTSMQALTTTTPLMAPLLTQFSEVVTTSATPVTNLSRALDDLVIALARLRESILVMDELTLAISKWATEAANVAPTANALANAINDTAKAFATGKENADAYTQSINGLYTPIEGLIDRMVELKRAASEALAAAQQAAGGSGGEVSADQKREGGYSTSTVDPTRVSAAAFHGAPRFAEGTANTSDLLRTARGGGIPAILHPNEAVIPLSRGRSVPVELTYQTDTTAIAQLAAAVSASVKDVISAREAKSEPTAESTSYRDPSPLRNPPVVDYANSRESTGPTRPSTSEPESKSPNAPIAITMNISTPDADSFRKSQDQINTEMYRKLRTAFNRNA